MSKQEAEETMSTSKPHTTTDNMLHLIAMLKKKLGKAPSTSEAEDALPPAYDTICPSDGHIAEVVKAWDKKSYAKGWPRTIQKPNLTFEFVPELCQHHTLERLLRNRKKQPSWHALLLVSARNIPQMMQRSFHWSAANIVKGEDQLVQNHQILPDYYGGKGVCWRYTRTYQLRNLPGEPKWKGVLRVSTMDLDYLYHFDLGQITKGTLITTKAYSCSRELVYYADKRSGRIYNFIFNNMPLDGWWPAPKREGEKLRGWDQ